MSHIPSRRASVLVIDDDVSMARILGRFLLRSGLHATSESSPYEGLRRIEQDAIDLVVCDLLMPELSGVELIRRARRKRPALPAIVISAYAQGAGVVDPRSCSTLFLVKPVPRIKLLFAVNDLLRSTRPST